MAKVLVLYYSSWGHIEQMAYARSRGSPRGWGRGRGQARARARAARGGAQQPHYKLDQKAPIATVEELPEYDAIIFGTPTRYGNMAAQMKNFLDQTGALWASGKLVGKVGSVFVLQRDPARRPGNDDPDLHPGPPASRHGRRGTALLVQGQMGVEKIMGGSPYGASTIVGDGSRSRARSNSTAPATRASTWQKSPESWPARFSSLRGGPPQPVVDGLAEPRLRNRRHRDRARRRPGRASRRRRTGARRPR